MVLVFEPGKYSVGGFETGSLESLKWQQKNNEKAYAKSGLVARLATSVANEVVLYTII